MLIEIKNRWNGNVLFSLEIGFGDGGS